MKLIGNVSLLSEEAGVAPMKSNTSLDLKRQLPRHRSPPHKLNEKITAEIATLNGDRILLRVLQKQHFLFLSGPKCCLTRFYQHDIQLWQKST